MWTFLYLICFVYCLLYNCINMFLIEKIPIKSLRLFFMAIRQTGNNCWFCFKQYLRELSYILFSIFKCEIPLYFLKDWKWIWKHRMWCSIQIPLTGLLQKVSGKQSGFVHHWRICVFCPFLRENRWSTLDHWLWIRFLNIYLDLTYETYTY